MTDGLNPCPTPWCEPEHEKYTWQGPDDLFCVICDGCQVEGPYCENEGDAQAAWNTRNTSLAAQDGLDDFDPALCPSCRKEDFDGCDDCGNCPTCCKCGAQDGLVEALGEIADPIGHMQQRAKDEGRKIDGQMAIVLSNDVEYLKNIARTALSAIKGDKS